MNLETTTWKDHQGHNITLHADGETALCNECAVNFKIPRVQQTAEKMMSGRWELKQPVDLSNWEAPDHRQWKAHLSSWEAPDHGQ